MLLGFVNDFSSEVTLDAQLLAVSDSGLYVNSGGHPSITIDNLLHFLSNKDITFSDYAAGTTYSKYEDSRLITDIVIDGGIIYQSLTAGNVGNTPASSSDDWLVTNIESIRLKFLLQDIEDRILLDINLVRRHVASEFIYNIVEQDSGITPVSMSNDFGAIILEAKGSDYTEFTINQAALQALTATPQNLYVINQGVLVDTISLTTNLEGRLEFQRLTNRTYSGKGRWIFAFDSQDVLTRNAYLDPLKYNGFVASTATGTGASPQDAVYTFASGSGLALDISVHFNPEQYVTSNIRNFGKFFKATIEMVAFEMFLANPNDRSNRHQRILMNDERLNLELLDGENNSTLKRYLDAKRDALEKIGKTDDLEIAQDDDIPVINVSSW